MATLGQLVANSLWFAFDALDHQKTGVVPKSQLKVRQLREANMGAAPMSCPSGVGEEGRCGPAWRVAHCRRDLLTLAPLVSHSLDLRGLPLPRAKYWGSSHWCAVSFRSRSLCVRGKALCQVRGLHGSETEVPGEEVGVSVPSVQVSHHRLSSCVPNSCVLYQ